MTEREPFVCEFCGNVPISGWCCRVGDAASRAEFGEWHPEHPDHCAYMKERSLATPREPDPWPIIEWLAENMPRALELCPYKISGLGSTVGITLREVLGCAERWEVDADGVAEDTEQAIQVVLYNRNEGDER